MSKSKTQFEENYGQVILEFTFCFIVVLLLIYGGIMAFRWAGVSLAQRRITHDNSIMNGINEKWSYFDDGPLKQLNPDFYKSMNMDLVYNGWDIAP